jgi:hypothetical protein
VWGHNRLTAKLRRGPYPIDTRTEKKPTLWPVASHTMFGAVWHVRDS